MAAKLTDAIIKAKVDRALQLEKQLATKVLDIKAAQDQIDSTWEAVKDTMVKNGVKSLKGDFGSITVAERTTFKTDNELSIELFYETLDEKLDGIANDSIGIKLAIKAAMEAVYLKLAPDTKKIGSHYALLGEAPEGAEAVVTQYLTKRLK